MRVKELNSELTNRTNSTILGSALFSFSEEKIT